MNSKDSVQSSTYGVLDLGGASAQVSFVPNTKVKSNQINFQLF